MSSIKELIRIHRLKLILIESLFVILLLIYYAVSGLDPDLKGKSAIYQNIIPTIFLSLITFSNIFLVTIVSPIPRTMESIRVKRKSDWLILTIVWLLGMSLLTAIVSTTVLQCVLLATDDSSIVYWSSYLQITFLTFQDLVLFQTVTLLLYLLMPKISYFFINCLFCLLLLLSSLTFVLGVPIRQLIGTTSLGQTNIQLFHSLITWGLVLLLWNCCSIILNRKENL